MSVWFNFGTNLDNAQFEVSQRVAQILNTLPPGIQQPFIIKFDITNMPVVRSVAVSSEALDEKQLYDLAYNVIEPQLERLPGVASATVGGGKQREIEVKVDRDALRARGLGILDVRQRRPGFEPAPAERKPPGRRARLQRLLEHAGFRGAAARGGRDPGSAAAPGQPGSATVRLGDVAKVEDSHRRPDRHRAHQRPARRLPARAQAARREHHRGRRCAARCLAQPARRAAT